MKKAARRCRRLLDLLLEADFVTDPIERQADGGDARQTAQAAAQTAQDRPEDLHTKPDICSPLFLSSGRVNTAVAGGKASAGTRVAISCAGPHRPAPRS